MAGGKRTQVRRPLRGRSRLGTRGMPRDQRMEEMLHAAARVFARRGYHAASMDEIAREADISKPLLYRYYASKEGLYIALIERAGRHLMDDVARIRREPDPAYRLEQAIGALLGFVDRYRDLWRVLFNEVVGCDSPVSRSVQAFRAQMIAGACTTIAELIGDPTPAGRRAAEPLSYALFGAGEALSRWWLEHPEVPVERVRELFLAFSLPAFRHWRGQRERRNARCADAR
ncbi:transcriptional regulator, TetR family [Fontimonas thermophila]|uniref:Transcriptional regulator, TetR family n=1 Tax=Fontimonas thermophila TaxID=1076937 RepID=A0A1I2J7R1_9GAMM|nr:TetR/AcrR family transcriptional regulator [Fontimonas thermophila]SFF50775.1 transcriptional regulator, TetR family [Fontimonas thermophila]